MPAQIFNTLCDRLVSVGVILCALLAVSSAAISSATADVIELRDGGQVMGTLVQRGSQGEYIVQTDEGARIVFSKAQVRKHSAKDKLQSEYIQRSRSLPDTLAAHRELAAWCKQQRLSKLVDHHLQRILELDPQDEQARHGLGFQQVDGKWLTREQIMTGRGLVFFAGAYRTPQDIVLRQRAERREEGEAEWYRRLKLWRGWLYGRSESRAAEAAQQIAEIVDPLATPAIVKLLDKDNDPQIRDLLIGRLAELNHPAAVKTLVALSLEDPDPEVRIGCVEYLLKSERTLSLIPYINALGSSSNQMVNRAGEALQAIGNPEAISPLIDALVTSHKYSIGGSPSGSINPSFSPRGSGGGGGGGLSTGSKPQFVLRDRQNVQVQRALVHLSGQNFQYDRQVWLRWFVNSQSRDKNESRRDD